MSYIYVDGMHVITHNATGIVSKAKEFDLAMEAMNIALTEARRALMSEAGIS